MYEEDGSPLFIRFRRELLKKKIKTTHSFEKKSDGDVVIFVGIKRGSRVTLFQKRFSFATVIMFTTYRSFLINALALIVDELTKEKR
jgi:hypothetical protein